MNMERSQGRSLIFFSIDQTDQATRVNFESSLLQLCPDFEVHLGMWQDTMEVSYSVDEVTFWTFVMRHPLLAKQECVLSVERSTRKAFIVPMRDLDPVAFEFQYIGYFVEVHRAHLNNLDGWTYCFKTDTYYSTMKL